MGTGRRKVGGGGRRGCVRESGRVGLVLQVRYVSGLGLQVGMEVIGVEGWGCVDGW